MSERGGNEDKCREVGTPIYRQSTLSRWMAGTVCDERVGDDS